MRSLKVTLLLLLALTLSLTACTRSAPVAEEGGPDTEEFLMHSIERTRRTFGDDALGLQRGDQVPVVFQEGRNLVLLTDEYLGTTLELLLELIRIEWTDKVTIVSNVELDLEAEPNWEIINDEGLIKEMNTSIFPALYVIEDGVVVHRVLPALPAFGIRIIEGLRGNYENSTGFAQIGKRLPHAELEQETGKPWNNDIRRNSVFVIVDTSCSVCVPAVEWAASLRGLDADIFLVVTASATYRTDNGLYIQQQHPDLMPGTIRAPDAEAEEKTVAEFIATFGGPQNVLIDRTESIFASWGVTSWPAAIITDKEGRVAEKMLLSWGSGRMDGIGMAHPTETVEGVLARLPR